MAVATTHAVALAGANGHVIDVQADVSAGLPGTTLVGRLDPAMTEGRDRVRMAVMNSAAAVENLQWPTTRRVTVLFSPADLRKSGTHFDLALALAILGATGAVPTNSFRDTVFLGELALDGALRPLTGALPMVLAAAQRGFKRVVLPEPQAAEAATAPGMEVLGLRSLAQVIAELRGELVPEAPPVAEASSSAILGWRGARRLEEGDMADILGMSDARYALEVAAAGGHHLHLTGPKGCGKTSLAERIPTILPPLDPQVAIELNAVRSLAGLFDAHQGLDVHAPFAAPHHDASKAALIGGGHGRVRPGALSLAHGGVLFLDEFALFRADAIDALREPLENGDITIARGDESVTLPARSIVVMASNPCPCGNFAPQLSADACTCTAVQRRDYMRKINGPITDRLDITRRLQPLHRGSADRPPEPSAAIRERVAAARQRQAIRYEGLPWRLNAHVPGAVLRDSWPVGEAAQYLVDEQLYGGRLTRRGAVRVHRLAWTVADLAGVDRPGIGEVSIALCLRHGDPLPIAALERRAA